MTMLRRLQVDALLCSGDFDDIDALMAAMQQGVELAGATTRQAVVEQFNPHGFTGVLILAESHLVLSTWPEYQYASMDAALCNEQQSPGLLVQPLLQLLQPQQCNETTIASSMVLPQSRQVKTTSTSASIEVSTGIGTGTGTSTSTSVGSRADIAGLVQSTVD